MPKAFKSGAKVFAKIGGEASSIFLRIYTQDEKAIILGGEFFTEINKFIPNHIQIAVGICTYKREEYVYGNLKKLQQELFNAGSVYQNHIDVYVSDNGQTLDPKKFSSPNMKIIPNKNLGGTGGFTRCMLEALFRKDQQKAYTHVLLMDDDILFETESICRLTMCAAVVNAGYKLFVQPMVTIDYTISEYNQLIDRIRELDPFAVSIVDSFGYMSKSELFKYFQLLDANLDKNVLIGFHSHNNMQMALMNAESLLSYKTDRTIIIDASLYGMGRGAGNLNTELIANYYNETVSYQFNVHGLLQLIGEYIYPISKEKPWGYSPYFYLTALYHCHPNYVTYLLSEHDVSVMEFERFMKFIPAEYKTKCRKPKVLEFYKGFKEQEK